MVKPYPQNHYRMRFDDLPTEDLERTLALIDGRGPFNWSTADTVDRIIILSILDRRHAA